MVMFVQLKKKKKRCHVTHGVGVFGRIFGNFFSADAIVRMRIAWDIGGWTESTVLWSRNRSLFWISDICIVYMLFSLMFQLYAMYC